MIIYSTIRELSFMRVNIYNLLLMQIEKLKSLKNAFTSRFTLLCTRNRITSRVKMESFRFSLLGLLIANYGSFNRGVLSVRVQV